jgi:hypothetical protein
MPIRRIAKFHLENEVKDGSFSWKRKEEGKRQASSDVERQSRSKPDHAIR